MFDRDAFGVNKNRLITRRMFVLSVAKIVVFTGIIGRLFSLQISENKKYSFLSEKNRLKAWKLPPKRGIFKDYFGNTIADNDQVFQLHVVPEEVEDFNYLMVRLKNIIKIENKEIGFIDIKLLEPFPTEYIKSLLKDSSVIVDIEANMTAQLGSLIRKNLLKDPDYYVLKYTGRPMTCIEIFDSLKKILEKKAEKKQVLLYGD